MWLLCRQPGHVCVVAMSSTWTCVCVVAMSSTWTCVCGCYVVNLDMCVVAMSSTWTCVWLLCRQPGHVCVVAVINLDMCVWLLCRQPGHVCVWLLCRQPGHVCVWLLCRQPGHVCGCYVVNLDMCVVAMSSTWTCVCGCCHQPGHVCVVAMSSTWTCVCGCYASTWTCVCGCSVVNLDMCVWLLCRQPGHVWFLCVRWSSTQTGRTWQFWYVQMWTVIDMAVCLPSTVRTRREGVPLSWNALSPPTWRQTDYTSRLSSTSVAASCGPPSWTVPLPLPLCSSYSGMYFYFHCDLN